MEKKSKEKSRKNRQGNRKEKSLIKKGEKCVELLTLRTSYVTAFLSEFNVASDMTGPALERKYEVPSYFISC